MTVPLPVCHYRQAEELASCVCTNPEWEYQTIDGRVALMMCFNCPMMPLKTPDRPPVPVESRIKPAPPPEKEYPVTIDQSAWVAEKVKEPTLSIGMAVVNDFQGMAFTAMSLQLQAKVELMHPVEIIIVENQNTDRPCKLTQEFCDKAGFKYKHYRERYGTAAPRDEIFNMASNEVVWSVDSHILLQQGSLYSTIKFFQERPESKDLVSGPLLDERGNVMATNWAPRWRSGMYGTWHLHKEGMAGNVPFEIPLMGLGSFAMRKNAWPGFHPKMRHFGGEEGYIHEKVRQRGGSCFCIPQAGWWHRFSKQTGGNYTNTWGDRIFNYLAGWIDLGKDPHEVIAHFQEEKMTLGIAEALELCRREGLSVPASPVVKKRANIKVLSVQDSTLEDNIGKKVGGPAIVVPRTITCLCPTFNRLGNVEQQALLEEAIEAFLRQSYPHKRLLILNDNPQQDAEFQHELVKVVNTGRRFVSLGDKHNALFSMADSEYLCMWDDDDISLPFRLEFLMERLGDADYYNPRRQWFMPGGVGGKLEHNHSHGVCFNSSIVKRIALRRIGMAPPTAASDMQMDRELQIHPHVVKATTPTPIPPSQWSYIYRWGVSNNHVSGHGQIDANYTSNGNTFVPFGTFKLNPHWRRDYALLVQQYLKANQLP